MFQATGQIINLFKSPASEKYEESYKVQILGDMPLVDGQVKKEMLTLNIPRAVFNSLQGRTNEEVSIPIGFYVKNGVLVTFFPKHGGGFEGSLPAAAGGGL
jgi:hypothetical protein